MNTFICRKILQFRTADNPKVMRMFDETVAEWVLYSQEHPDFDFSQLMTAITFAASAHAGQIRKDREGTPYIIHPIGVARILWEEGKIQDVDILIGALLHDVLEDTNFTPDSISKHFGADILKIVIELTDPKLSSQEKKQRQIEKAPHMSQSAKLIKLADRLYNIRDLKASPPLKWTSEDIQSYMQWGRKLLDVLRGTNEFLEEALEKEL